jgi:formylglycine-generating enzyme required for sulfatase activity
MEFVYIRPPGSAAGGDGGQGTAETITKAFYLGKYEMTCEQYAAAKGEDPDTSKNPKVPVSGISHDIAVRFLRDLSKKTGYSFRLPVTAEWMYACRAGATTEWPFGDNPADLKEYAWFGENSGGRPHPVGQKKPNAWGLYDMLGNASEYTREWRGRAGVSRGGAYVSGSAAECRPTTTQSKLHHASLKHFGIRVALDVPELSKLRP